MATESDGEEETAAAGACRRLTGLPQLEVHDDLREMAKKAAWSVSSCKPGNGVQALRDDNLDTYWQSDGAQPHLVNIQFQKKVKLKLVVIYVDYKLDESYTPSKISIRAGDGFHNLKEIKTVELLKPVGWVHISLSGTDPRGRNSSGCFVNHDEIFFLLVALQPVSMWKMEGNIYSYFYASSRYFIQPPEWEGHTYTPDQNIWASTMQIVLLSSSSKFLPMVMVAWLLQWKFV